MNEHGLCLSTGEYVTRSEEPPSSNGLDWQNVIFGLQNDASYIASAVLHDARLRRWYRETAAALSKRYMQMIQAGEMTAWQAAKEANALRNLVMEVARAESGAIGREVAKWIKEEGLSFSAALEKYALKLFGRPLDALDDAARGEVYAAIVLKAGVTNARVNFIMNALPKLGRGFAVANVAIIVYQVANAEDPAREGVRQGGAAVGGVVLGGLAASLACGPAAPGCAVIALFVGGVVGSLVGESVADGLMQ